MSPRTFDSPAALLDAVGIDLGSSEWMLIDQQRIDAFADATGDHQWIHLDSERASTGPFGGTIAHGYLTVSLLSSFIESLLDVRGASMAINYGLDRVRFLQPVRSGSRVRGSVSIASADTTKTGVRLGLHITVDIDGDDRPALVADTIALFIAADA